MTLESTRQSTKQQLTAQQWRCAATEYSSAMKRWTEPYRARRCAGKSHPIHDFLFVYYRYSPSRLEEWHPGIDMHLLCDPDIELSHFSPRHYSRSDGAIFCDPLKMTNQLRERLEWIADLLRQTGERRGNYSCFGLHEWAMVYKGDDVRHRETTKFRLSQSEIDKVVESRPITCSHFDAFRFFADEARPLNRLLPTLEKRAEMEQPACIHANMDLYKWAFKAMPWVGSPLLRECFELAMQARAIDMRASPYELSKYDDYPPIRIETAAGRAQYETFQRSLAQQASVLRERLIRKIARAIELASTGTAT